MLCMSIAFNRVRKPERHSGLDDLPERLAEAAEPPQLAVLTAEACVVLIASQCQLDDMDGALAVLNRRLVLVSAYLQRRLCWTYSGTCQADKDKSGALHEELTMSEPHTCRRRFIGSS